jgi:ribosomal protein S27E
MVGRVWIIAPVSKTDVASKPPGVRIPHHPPFLKGDTMNAVKKQMVKCGGCEHEIYAIGETSKKCPVCAASPKVMVKCGGCGHEALYPTSITWWDCEKCGWDGVGR